MTIKRPVIADLILALLIILLFWLSHQVYCQNDLSMRIYQWIRDLAGPVPEATCIEGLNLSSIRNWLPDALWSFMLSLIWCRLWHESLNSPYLIASLLIGVTGYEWLQLLGLAAGTFDIWDVVVSLLGAVTAYILMWYLQRWLYVQNHSNADPD